jgi:hypothetical protein
MNWDDMIKEVLTDVGKLVSATPTIKYIIGIVQWNGKLFAHPVYQPTPFDIVNAPEGAVTGVATMPEPPTDWKSIELEIVPKKNGAASREDMPIAYFLMKDDDGTGLGIPSRFNREGQIGYSGNEQIIDYVEAVLTRVGLLVILPKATK